LQNIEWHLELNRTSHKDWTLAFSGGVAKRIHEQFSGLARN